MKKYNTVFIKEYIESHKTSIASVYCGMREDWFWTADIVFENGELCTDFDWDSEYISVSGIDGSSWATPVMEVEFLDGRAEVVECWIYDGEEADAATVAWQKTFCAATGGMDYRG